MNKVFVPNIDAVETMELVRELRSKGLVQGKDFDFAYQHGKISFFAEDIESLKGCDFTFTDSKWATFFRMKYGC